MLKKNFKDLHLPAIAMGTMRLPVLNGINADIDVESTKKMVKYAFEHDVNYFDTAYAYHMGNSEIVMGDILSEYPRDSFFLADKFPGYDLNNMPKVGEIFEEQLNKCKVDYFDFYLVHNVYERNLPGYLNPEYGVVPYLIKQREMGRIKHLGFSSHGKLDVLKSFLDVYGDEMEFCMIELNYVDWILQHADEKCDLLNDKNIPIWVMEPMRGGSILSLSSENKDKLKALRPDSSSVEWAFNFLQSIPGVTVILSGASSPEQFAENIGIFEEKINPLNDKEMETILEVGNSMVDISPCTKCNYCVSYCPFEFNIPSILELYSDAKFKHSIISHMAYDAIDAEHHPSKCISCKTCNDVCPQKIDIAGSIKKLNTIMKGEPEM